MKNMIEESFGNTKTGDKTTLYTLTNEAGMRISVTDYGAALVKVIVPDKGGMLRDVVLGYDEVQGYEMGGVFFGATVGRCANRIGGASVEIDGCEYLLNKNDGGNCLHGGCDFYHMRVWNMVNATDCEVTFELDSPNMDQGFPGNLNMQVTYALSEDNELKISYRGTSDKTTVINMTNHSYFNLNGQGNGDILKHQVFIDADTFTRNDAGSVPTGEIVGVAGTPMDFRTKKEVGADITSDYEAVVSGNGYDHNWVLNAPGSFRKIAVAAGDLSGIEMEVYTDLPGVQFYTANFVENERGKGGNVYQKRDAMCFETQYFPDAVHHPNFEQPIFRAGEIYQTSTMYKFIAV